MLVTLPVALYFSTFVQFPKTRSTPVGNEASTVRAEGPLSIAGKVVLHSFAAFRLR
jgi:hypothetical protein